MHKQTAGLFDIQINGFAGVDFNNASICSADIDQALEAMLATGVTACLPTLITAEFSVLKERFMALDQAVMESRLGPLMIPGYHLEGPFLNPQDGFAGCHPASAMIKPDASVVLSLEKALSRPILVVTYAPESDVDLEFTRALQKAGKCLSMGHSAAEFAVVNKAVSAGLSLSTHLGNGLPHQLHKFNNPLFAQLACDDMYAGFIADGIHIPPHVLKSLLRAKGLAHSILVTDAVSAAATEKAGLYDFAGMKIERTEDGTVRIPNSNYLAGSSLTLDSAVRHVVDWALAEFDQAIQMASFNPRRALERAFDLHHIRLAESFVEWDESLRVVCSQVGGERRSYR